VGVDAGNGQAAASAEEESSLELLLLSAPLPDSLLCLTWPLVTGFSFAAKCWGTATVSGLRDISFNEAAFERLVLPPSRKNLIAALVGSYKESDRELGGAGVMRTDIIAGKGEGTIFLLHGPPGCGKTLTAEAVAELLHKPLYCVSMGELGTTPETLEDRLMEVLELCAGWGALALIDEADMLLEARTSSSDIVRNAMVCVMLRLLEYHQGILFLTTNRVNALDAAFQSRVSCALRYDALDEPSRHAIWRDLLSRARDNVGPEVDPAMLATHKLNGRQIKNVLQLAEALSRHEGTTIQQRHLDATLEMTAAFVAEVAEGK
jgi:SpoVK/Ycf46/Vps4 family AAA+-type ATPase